MAAIKVVAVVMVALVMVAGHASVAVASHAPNSWFSCMANCPKYNCSSWWPAVACDAYCATQCAIPPKTNTFTADAADVVDRFCKLGCVSSKCTALTSSMLGAQAVESCIHGCSDLCTSSTNQA